MGDGLWIALGVVCVIFLAMALAMFRWGNMKEKEYDERQVLARGRAYRSGFVALVVLCILYAALSEAGVMAWCSTAAGCCLCICLAATVFALQCIASDAFAGFATAPRATAGLLALGAAVNLMFGVMQGLDGELIVDGVLTVWSCNLMIGAMLAVILCAFLIRQHRARKAEDL